MIPTSHFLPPSIHVFSHGEHPELTHPSSVIFFEPLTRVREPQTEIERTFYRILRENTSFFERSRYRRYRFHLRVKTIIRETFHGVVKLLLFLFFHILGTIGFVIGFFLPKNTALLSQRFRLLAQKSSLSFKITAFIFAFLSWEYILPISILLYSAHLGNDYHAKLIVQRWFRLKNSRLNQPE